MKQEQKRIWGKRTESSQQTNSLPGPPGFGVITSWRDQKGQPHPWYRLPHVPWASTNSVTPVSGTRSRISSNYRLTSPPKNSVLARASHSGAPQCTYWCCHNDWGAAGKAGLGWTVGLAFLAAKWQQTCNLGCVSNSGGNNEAWDHRAVELLLKHCRSLDIRCPPAPGNATSFPPLQTDRGFLL